MCMLYQVIKVISTEVREGWWRGVIADGMGLFPSTYVEILSEEDSTHYTGLRYAHVIHPYEPQTTNELHLKLGQVHVKTL